jgi:hypothetical protein
MKSGHMKLTSGDQRQCLYSERSWSRIAALAPVVMECAVQVCFRWLDSDPDAQLLCVFTSRELLRAVQAVISRLDLERSGLCIGRVARAATMLRRSTSAIAGCWCEHISSAVYRRVAD